ncbi:hypothetical protein BX616_002791 [Lobosporangium transversale]|uniref:TATA element modulatory factor 1 TATA binding domain-containing protein n=1 Tax=Lobosporangium transversale TaxID=64571 RepID=A0A1Y2H2A2_9FUNG|nr:hypothetical protein BCR41DRAFT_382644 [Lobosporangium transversale]KAF9916795.1 hypothetical protein BX616_002791 [Lobosporangium transversale]ORZ28665.1 hypothetical protein BCR41DRAFT_382644 [Lobosporangium transversale]|eukprot:XP_021886338.1 hypothetical protein BCR41DRAFT_382644 [Lobosporangium transversale]
MSNFFGTAGSGSGTNANKLSSNNNGGSSGSGSGGWGSFLKQGLSTIESKLDMVLDIQVPIHGGAAGTLTSFSPNATVLPSSITSQSTTKDTQPKEVAPPQVPSSGDSADTGDAGTQNKSGKNHDTLRKPSNMASSARGSQDGLKMNVKKEEATVTVDPFTGMITTTPTVKRMSTPPVSGSDNNNNPSSLVSNASTTLSAAAAAAAANRERLEQRMRGIFKKAAPESPSATPTAIAAHSRTASPSSSVRRSMSAEKDDKAIDKNSVERTRESTVAASTDEETKFSKEDMKDIQEATQKDVQNDTQKDTQKDMQKSTQEDVETDVQEDNEKVLESKDKASEVQDLTEITSDVEKDNDSKDQLTISDSLEQAKVEPILAQEGQEDANYEDSLNGKEFIKADAEDKQEEVTPSESTVETIKVDKEQPAVKKEENNVVHEPEQNTTEDQPSQEETALTSEPEKSTAASSEQTTDAKASTSTDHPNTQIEDIKAPTSASATEGITPVNIEPELKVKERHETNNENPLQKVLEQREEQLFKAMQEQSSLLEKLRDLEDAKAAEDALKATKIAGLEKIIETQKKELEVARGSNLTSQPKSIQKTLEEQRALLEDKDEQIRGLLAEGEVLSKKEFKNLTTIKALRTKNIEAEKLQMDTQKKLDKVLSDYADAQAKISKLMDENKQLNESIKSLQDINQRQNKQLTKMEAELFQLKEEKANLQLGLDRAWQELAEARKASAELSNQAHAASLEREMKLNEELNNEMEALKAQHAAIEANLRQDIQELRVSLSNREESAGEREDQLLMEIRNLQARLEQTDNDSYELQEALDEARRPLLRQIEALQNQQSVANRNWDKIEKNLTRRIAEAEEDALKAQERERSARDKLDEMKSRYVALEARLEALRTSDIQLRAEISDSKRNLKDKEDEARRMQAELTQERLNRERAIEEARDDAERKLRLLQQTEMNKLKQQIQQLQQQQSQGAIGEDTRYPNNASDPHLSMGATSAAATMRRPSSSAGLSSPLFPPGSPLTMSGSKTLGAQAQGSVRSSLELIASPASLDGMSPSLSRTGSSQAVGLVGLSSNATGQAVAVERLSTVVRQLEGQVTFLSEQVRTANRNKDELSNELVRVTMELEDLQKQAARLPGLKQELDLLQERHRAALEMLGERTEEVQELKADLLDVKEAYRDQVSELLSQLETARRAIKN